VVVVPVVVVLLLLTVVKDIGAVVWNFLCVFVSVSTMMPKAAEFSHVWCSMSSFLRMVLQ